MSKEQRSESDRGVKIENEGGRVKGEGGLENGSECCSDHHPLEISWDLSILFCLLVFFCVCVHGAGVATFQCLGLGYCSVGTAQPSKRLFVLITVLGTF